MRLLIGNHIDPDLVWQRDRRTFSQRVVWFARTGDVIVLPDEPDRRFVAYVTSLTGTPPESLTFVVAAPGRYGGKLLDPHALLDDGLVQQLAPIATQLTEVVSCWPSPEVAQLAHRLGIADRLPGAAFFAQDGAELANNKASFRAFAAACGVPIADGAVCRTRGDAQLAIERLLVAHRAIVIKQAHHHAGLGNELLVLDDGDPHGHVGAMYLRRLEATCASVRRYLDERWDWASVEGRQAVVVEQFKPRGRTIYSEYVAGDRGVSHAACGELVYRGRRLVAELAPVRDIAADVRARLIHNGARLAELYRGIGYRGYLSADAVVDRDGDLIITEMNARIGGSPHIYEGIGRVVDLHRSPQRTVIQYSTPPHWRVPAFDAFLATVDALGYGYDRARRSGVIAAIPSSPDVHGGGILFCVAYEAEHEHVEVFDALDRAFRAPGLARVSHG